MPPGGAFRTVWLTALSGAILGAAGAHAAPLSFTPAAELTQPLLTLGDVVDVKALPPAMQARASGLVLARAPAGAAVVRYAARRLAERATALLPALGPWLAQEPDTPVDVTVRATPRTTPVRGGPCLVARIAIGAGEIARADAFSPSFCARPPADVFHFDRQTGLARVVADLKAGDTAPRVPESDLAVVSPGQPLYVSASAGPVRVERAVRAVQPAAARRSLFVMADDGTVFSAPPPQEDQR